ncbi:DUF1501 domain-containing protein [Anatilimnocola floriformis]|uniref:DUF1501 domain-containing protein n=1 Tax=Anatilimnocola floriformis TaxID=2948575 RepID=UPI0020C42A34|nr:DUF1501 domain-containing protein [Anatilimnocola floriformis]
MWNRRQLLQASATGFGWLAFSALHAQENTKYRSPLAPKPQHFPAKAKRVIFFFMAGGPSHVDTFDWKPELAKAGPGGKSKYLAPVFKFNRSGQSGLPISEIFPHLAKHADRLCLLNGMHTAVAGHQQATVAVHTGNPSFVRPSFGSWITYGLGSIADDLPGFVTINPLGDQGGAQNYGSAFLPAAHQGTRLGTGSRGVPNVANRHLTAGDQRKQLDFLAETNRRLLAENPTDPAIAGLIESYELAYKMQTSVPETLDLNRESAATRALYGLDDAATSSFGEQCLTARRLAEKGVRFIQLTSQGWDQHNNLREAHGRNATAIDKPIAGLISDLSQRGMLDETLLIWGGEFGRTPRDDKGDGNGRGHANRGYSMWLCGGGVKGGLRYGATDEMGDAAIEGRMGTHDLHATILHLLGLDHEALTFKYAGCDFRLTDTSGEVAKGVIA